LARSRFSVASRTPYWIRLKISGRGPVLIQAKVWKASRSEPAGWTVQTSHAGPGKLIVRRGSFGFILIHDDVNKRKGRVKVSGVKVLAADRRRLSAPEATFAFAGRIQPTSGGRYRARAVVKSDIPGTIAFEVGTDPRLRNSAVVSGTEVIPKANVTKTWLEGLEPGSTVYWRPLLTSRSGRLNQGLIRSFRTPPAPGQEVSFAFGSCSHSFSTSRSFDTAAGLGPYFFAHLGDFGYPQNPLGSAAATFSVGSFQDRWTRMLARRSMTNLHRRAAWIMLQDDHDYGMENCWSGNVRRFTVPAFDELSGNLNARHFDVRYGDMHCFFIDAHLHSDDPLAPDGPGHSMIGDGQKAWLKQSMSSSDAPLLILFSPMPFWGAGFGVTSWKSAFAQERRELLDFFASLQGPDRRVVICSGNSHAQVINRHSDPDGGKDVIEFVSSETDKHLPKQLRSVPGDGVIDGTRSIKGAEAFGYVRLKAAGNNPRVELRAIDSVTGRDVWPMLAVDL
ncbi:MAG: alkaline phosphatase D family protein, partial [Actinomycetota bacterium]|nr:alkaline phosphatase D family protein [Actinomycetota bacterium]